MSRRIESTECARGHPKSEARWIKGSMRCRTCYNASIQRWRTKNREHYNAYMREYRKRRKGS